jgi:hypothetical protein
VMVREYGAKIKKCGFALWTALRERQKTGLTTHVLLALTNWSNVKLLVNSMVLLLMCMLM